jgi:adenine-specific DNA-methyltransferase
MGKPVYVPTGKEKVAQVPDEWRDVPPDKLLEKRKKYK